MNKALSAVLLLLMLVFVGYNAMFVVSEGHQVIVTQFGKPVGERIEDAGLYFKIPFIQKLHYFDKRILKWDGDPNEIPTKDKKYIWIDTTARWRINDPLVFLQRMGSLSRADMTLSDLINGAVRDFVTKNDLVEIVRSSDTGEQFNMSTESSATKKEVRVGRDGFSQMVLLSVEQKVQDLGIELLDVLVKRVNYTDQVREKVYARMISERQRIATQTRSEGEAVKAQILGETEKRLKEIVSGAYKKAQQIRGVADAQSIRLSGEAYGVDPEFYRFMATLDTYKTTLGENTRLVIDSNSPLYEFLSPKLRK